MHDVYANYYKEGNSLWYYAKCCLLLCMLYNSVSLHARVSVKQAALSYQVHDHTKCMISRAARTTSAVSEFKKSAFGAMHQATKHRIPLISDNNLVLQDYNHGIDWDGPCVTNIVENVEIPPTSYRSPLYK